MFLPLFAPACLRVARENELTFYTKLEVEISLKMTTNESDQIIKEVKTVFDELSKYSEEAQLNCFLSCYDNSLAFSHFSSDGKMRNYEEFKMICVEYYTTLKQQKLSTVTEKFNVIDTNLVIAGWTGNIKAQFKNGNTMIMKDYSITNVFRKIGDKWKIIHSHESSLPPEIQKLKS